MLIKLVASLVLISSVLSAEEKFSFHGYKLIRITPKSLNHIQLLNHWENNPEVKIALFFFCLIE